MHVLCSTVTLTVICSFPDVICSVRGEWNSKGNFRLHHQIGGFA